MIHVTVRLNDVEENGERAVAVTTAHFRDFPDKWINWILLLLLLLLLKLIIESETVLEMKCL